jgi:hypothetical protein
LYQRDKCLISIALSGLRAADARQAPDFPRCPGVANKIDRSHCGVRCGLCSSHPFAQLRKFGRTSGVAPTEYACVRARAQANSPRWLPKGRRRHCEKSAQSDFPVNSVRMAAQALGAIPCLRRSFVKAPSKLSRSIRRQPLPLLSIIPESLVIPAGQGTRETETLSLSLSFSLSLSIYIYIYIYICLSSYLSISLSLYLIHARTHARRERERERERVSKRGRGEPVCVHVRACA